MPGFRVEPIVDRATQSIRIRALRNIRSHGESSGQSSGAQLRLALRGVRSGCGIRIVARPSSLDRPAMASAEPLGLAGYAVAGLPRSEEHTSELQSLMRRSYAVFCLKKKHKT